MSQSIVKDGILHSASKSCDLYPIHSKLLIECLDSTLHSVIDLVNSSLASGISPQCIESALVTPMMKKRRLGQNDLNNYRPVSNLCRSAKILVDIVLSQVSSYPKLLPTSTHTIFPILCNEHIVLVTALKQFI